VPILGILSYVVGLLLEEEETYKLAQANDVASGGFLPLFTLCLFNSDMGDSNSWRLCAHHTHLVILPSLRTPLRLQESRGFEQKFLIGVILMVPCYAVESLISLVNPSISVDIEILRDCYESFAMYCFGRYLVACLGGEERTIEFMEREGRASSKTPLLEHGSEHKRGIVKHPFPMNYMLKPWKLGRWFYQVVNLKNDKLNHSWQMMIKALTAILAVVLEASGVYCEGEFKWGCGYPYMAVVLNFSQSWALYCLVQFYTATKDELAHIKPLYKFLTFKSIVFLTWWQGVAIALLSTLGLVQSPIAQGLQFKSSIQDFIICIEMGIASLVHLYVFPSTPYELMGDRFQGSVSVLGDYASVDCPIDPDEVRDSERPTKLRLPQPDDDGRSGTAIKDSVRDVVVGGGGYIVSDLRFTVTQAVEPVEKGITKFNEKLHKISKNITRDKDRRKTKDDSCIDSPTQRVIRGIDDPLLNGSFSDSGMARGKRQRQKSESASAESGGESSGDQSYGGYQIRGHRWVTKD
ncbi:Protein laz1, partial [Turnera subulata]